MRGQQSQLQLADPFNPANPCGLKEALTAVAGGVNNQGCDTSNPTNPANPCGIKQNVALFQGALVNAAQAARRSGA